MSGFLAVFNTDGTPLQPELLGLMSAALARRGPDGQERWLGECCGLAHSELRIDAGRRNESQPCTLDGRTWIVADARIDGRKDLMERLNAAGVRPADDATDAELILHAFRAWGDDCLGRFIGDFAFAIWDQEQRRLFCACDHFGVKPLYYATVGQTLIASNTLPALLAHPGLPRDLNELAIADFLLFGSMQDADSTAYAQIRCLPAAHGMTCSVNGRMATRRYWSLPTDGRIRYRRQREYVEHFTDLLTAAIDDRLPQDRVAIFMSGGLDSTSIAAVAKDCNSRRSRPCQLTAHTMTYQGLTSTPEGRFARLAAEWMQIPLDVFDGSTFHPFANWETADWLQPEPCDLTFAEANRQFVLSVKQSGAQVVLSGQGGDPILATTKDEFWRLLIGGRLPQAASYLGRHVWQYQRLPPLILRSRLKGLWSRPTPQPFPAGLSRELVKACRLHDRWNDSQSPPTAGHPTRPEAVAALDAAYWQWNFRRADAAMSKVGLEARHPLFDVRLVEYVLAIPPSPWFLEKSILREAVQGKLPEVIRRRPKCPASGHPFTGYQRRHPGPLLPGLRIPDKLARFVAPETAHDIMADVNSCKDGGVGIRLRCLALAIWLHHARGAEEEREVAP
jgi:asparagine synthase (glutamine-hydrolysing)